MKKPPKASVIQSSKKHHGEHLVKTVLRLILTYLVPIILLTLYFHFQSFKIFQESRKNHARLIAEHQSNILDLFLRERVVNLTNIIDDPALIKSVSSNEFDPYLHKLKKISDTFVDIGYFDSTGVQIAYAGPYPFLKNHNYSSEPWYIALQDSLRGFIITDIYMGFRKQPHFTIAVSRRFNNHKIILRATLDPEKITRYVLSLESENEALTSIVNREGFYQIVSPKIGEILQKSVIIPPTDHKLGSNSVIINKSRTCFGYSWLQMVDWALLVQLTDTDSSFPYLGVDLTVKFVTAGSILIVLVTILFRARKLVQLEESSAETRIQLEHAAKLATVGELAGGIAHEINNPLAIISEEAGLMKDLMSPEFAETITPEEIKEHLETIHEAVFRARDITRKLLGFVRKTEFKLETHNIHDIIDDVVDGFLGPEMALDNIEIERNFDQNIPPFVTDKSQLEQVILNIVKNGCDAMEGPGKIIIETSLNEENISVSITDTGCGMTREQLGQIFLPFYTTKEVGRGTGLGLSVSYGIIKSLGGTIDVDSVPGRGSIFKIQLPLQLHHQKRI